MAVLTGEEVLDPARNIGFVMPLPYGLIPVLGKDREVTTALSILSEAAYHAGALIMNNHPEATMLVAGERPFMDLPGTTDLAMQKVREIAPAAHLVPLRKSDGGGYDNTYQQTKAFSDHVEEAEPLGGDEDEATENIELPLNYHGPRVRGAGKTAGLPASFVTVENVLHAAGITEYDPYLKLTKRLVMTELFARAVTLFDREGRIINAQMERTGPRLVNVVEYTSRGGKTKYRVDSTFAYKRRKQLEEEAKAIAGDSSQTEAV